MLIYFKDIIFFRSIKERRNAYFGVASARGKNWNILLALFQNKWFRGFYIWTTHLISIILVRFFLGHGQLLPSLHSYQSLLLYLLLNWSRLFHEILSYYFFWIALFLSICLLLSSFYLFFCCCLSRPVCQEHRLTVLFCFCLSVPRRFLRSFLFLAHHFFMLFYYLFFFLEQKDSQGKDAI